MGKLEDGKVIRVGPKMIEFIQAQKKLIKEVTYDIVGVSDFDCCEVIAEKFKSKL